MQRESVTLNVPVFHKHLIGVIKYRGEVLVEGQDC